MPTRASVLSPARAPLPLPLLLGLSLLLLLSAGYSFYALRRVDALDRQMRAMREETRLVNGCER